MGPKEMSAAPKRPSLVLVTLILSAIAVNLSLSVANIALPGIGRALDASQLSLNLVAVGFSLGLAASVLYTGAIGDRYGRKQMLLLGLGLTVPFSLLSAYAPNTEVLIVGRLLSGLAAGLAFPTTLALVAALWAPGPGRTKAIALWSGIGSGFAVIGPVISGFLLASFWWGSVFLIAVPPALVALVLAAFFIPSHVNESTERVDHLGGVMSMVLVASLVLGLSVVTSPGFLPAALAMFLITLVSCALFLRREARVANPLYELNVARRRLFWVPALAGIIVFGALMGAMFIGQQFLQNVLLYSTVNAGFAVLPSAIGMMAVATLSGRLVTSRGSRFTLLAGFLFTLAGFVLMLVMWKATTSVWVVSVTYLIIGIGVGLALTPASRSLTSSVPISRLGMASGTADLQRDLGGSVMQALLGAFLTAGYVSAMATRIGSSPEASTVTDSTKGVLEKSFSSAENLAQQYPQYQQQIMDAAKESFLAGANWAFATGLVAVLIGAVLVLVAFPGKDRELQLLATYAAEDR